MNKEDQARTQMSEETDKLWKAVSLLQQDRASMDAHMKNTINALNKLTDTVERSMEKITEKSGQRDVEMAVIKGSVKDLGVKVKDHLDKHWQWLTLVVTASGVVVATIKTFWGREN